MKHINKQLTAIASILIFSIGIMLSCNSFAAGGKKATQAALDAEISDRMAEDASLQGLISTEITDREAAADALQSQIGEIQVVPAGDKNGDMLYWDGAEWDLIPAPVAGEANAFLFSDGKPHWGYQIGDKGPAGGIVFYVDASGSHGLEAAPVDQDDGSRAQWGCYGTETGADGTAVGAGAQNTADILLGCTTSGIAAELADNYELNGSADWFLPSKEELNLMYNNLHTHGKGSFASDYYWSSSEDDSDDAWGQSFDDSYQGVGGKFSTLRVRAVRAF